MQLLLYTVQNRVSLQKYMALVLLMVFMLQQPVSTEFSLLWIIKSDNIFFKYFLCLPAGQNKFDIGFYVPSQSRSNLCIANFIFLGDDVFKLFSTGCTNLCYADGRTDMWAQLGLNALYEAKLPCACQASEASNGVSPS